MIRISRLDKDRLVEAGLLKPRYPKDTTDPRLYVANREHNSKDKTYYVREDRDIMMFLGLKVESNHNYQPRNKNKNSNNGNNNYKKNYNSSYFKGDKANSNRNNKNNNS